jgi:hypothetical protein
MQHVQIQIMMVHLLLLHGARHRRGEKETNVKANIGQQKCPPEGAEMLKMRIKEQIVYAYLKAWARS